MVSLMAASNQGMLARKDRIEVPEHYHLDLAHRWLVDLYEAWAKPEKAAEWRAKPTTRALANLIGILSCSAGLGSRVLCRVCTVPIPVDNREADRVGLGLSRLAPFALLAELAVNRVVRDDSARRIRLAMDAFISVLLWCVNKRKEPPRAAAPTGAANNVGFSCCPPI